MCKPFAKTIVLVVLITLAAGCGPDAPTAAPVSPTASPLPATPVPHAATTIPPTLVPTALPLALTVAVPPGNPPKLDGTLSPGEWDGARREKFSDGSELWLMQNGGYLYLGVRVNLHTIWSVYLDHGDEIAVLHSSGSLGTAVYQHTESDWQRTRTFAWTLQDKSNNETAQQQRKQFLEQEGWLASLGTMGKPEEVEYQLAMPQGALRLAVAFPWPPSFDKAAVWPVELDDDVCNIDLLEGDAPAQARFSTERWAVVTVATATVTLTPPQPTATSDTPLSGSSGRLIAFVSKRDGNDEIYLMNADGSDQQNLTHHPASDTDPAWSPSSSKIAFSSDRDGNLEIYVMDADGTNPQRLAQNPAVDVQPAWSPDGTQLAFVSLRNGNAEIYVMNVDGSNSQRVTRTEANEFEFDWSPDGTQIVFASSEGIYANIYVMNSDGSERQQLTDTDAHNFYPRWSPDGTQIAFLSKRDGILEEIYLMAADGSNQRRLTRNNAFDGAPSWSPDGTQLVFASDRDGNHELYVMDSDGSSVRRLTDNSAADSKPAWRLGLQTTTNTLALAMISGDTVNRVERLHTLSGHRDRVYGLAFSSGGRLLLSGSWDGTLRLWDVETWQQVGLVNQEGQWRVFFVPDDAHVASANGTIVDVASGEIVHTLPARNRHVAFSPDGAWMALAGYNAPIEIWDVNAWQPVQTLAGHTDRVFGLAFSPNGHLLASGSGLGPSDVSDFVVKVWDITSGSELYTLKGHSGDIHAVAFSPDGALVASASTDYTVRVWDVQSGALVHTLRHGNGLYGVTFSPDGRLLAAAGCDRTVKLWDVASGRMLRSLPHADEVMAVAFSPDGTLLASGGYDHQIYLWGVSR